MNISEDTMQAMGYSNPYSGFEIVDIREDGNLSLSNKRYHMVIDSINQTAIRLDRRAAILENVAEKHFPYDLIPYYRERYQSIVMVIRPNNLITLLAICKVKSPGAVLTLNNV